MSTFLQRMGQRLSSNKIPIIMVHGVFDLDPGEMKKWNPIGKHLHLSQFENTLEKLVKDFKALSLDDMLKHKQNKTWPKAPSFALTFDDGYAGFEELVLPLLEKHNCPASFFPVIHFVDGNMLWMDQVESVILATVDFVTPEGELKPRDEALQAWKDAFKKKSSKERNVLLDKYFQLPESYKRPKQYQGVDWEELRRLNEHPLVTIGNHSLSHPILALEEKESMETEIIGAAERLRHELGHCHLFCYPNGSEDDHNLKTLQVIKETGHDLALLTHEALTSAKTENYLLPRFSLSANTFDSPWFWNGVYGLRDLKKKFLP
jgi:peptidoglycan/xylan/chitin deacetylase (PgdA/CDA1 family)